MIAIFLINCTQGSAWTLAAVASDALVPPPSPDVVAAIRDQYPRLITCPCAWSLILTVSTTLSLCFSMIQDATQMVQQCPTLHCTTKQQVEWMPVLPQKTCRSWLCSCFTHACPYLVWPNSAIYTIWSASYCWQQLLFQSYITAEVLHAYISHIRCRCNSNNSALCSDKQ